MSPLKAIIVIPPPPPRRVPAWRLLSAATFVLLLAFACRETAANSGVQEIGEGDVRKAEKVLAKLRLLHEAAAAGDAEAYRKLTSKFYPDLFVKVAELRPSDLNTDLSTAVFLAEALGRTWTSAGAASADCLRERPDIYQPLCLSLRDGTVRELLLSKSRLHARWAEAVLRSHKGETDAEVARALGEMADARANDLLIAARVVETLRPFEELLRDAASAGSHKGGGDFADALSDAGALLAWMPRGQTFYRLSAARQAYADGLSWRQKASESTRPVVSVKSFAPDPLKILDLSAGQAATNAEANWKSAARLTRLTRQSLSQASR